MSVARLHVVWQGDFGGESSIALVNRELARRLASETVLSLAPSDGPPHEGELARLVGRRLPRVDVVMRHSSSPVATRPRVGRWVWMTPWEYGAALPVEWLSAMRRDVEVVCANSAWTGQLFEESGVARERVAVTPNGVDTARFHPAATPIPLGTDKRTRFLFVGRMSHRKGIELALLAYRRAFSDRDDVVLVIKPCETDGVSSSDVVNRIARAFADPPSPAVTILPTRMREDDLPGIYTACDALIHPYRGESFCLPIAEAMACGTPVIATDRGGASMIATPETATLISSVLVHLPRLALGNRRVSNFPHWQEPVVADLVSAMRAIHENPSAARLKAARARQMIVERFTWDHSVDAVRRAFEIATSALPRRHPEGLTARERERLLEDGDTHLRAARFDSAAHAYHRCLGRDALLADRANGREIAAQALLGLGHVAREHGMEHYASRFFRLKSKLYSSGRFVNLETT
jgi:glycosyltransferase involved in cell wall biosynthesis